MIGNLDKIIRPLVLKIFKDKSKVKNENDKLMSLLIDDDKLLKKYKTILTKIEFLPNIKLDALPVYLDRYIKAKIRTYGDKGYTNCLGYTKGYTILFVMVFIICWCSMLMLAILLLSLLKVLIIVVLFMTLANMIQLIYIYINYS